MKKFNVLFILFLLFCAPAFALPKRIISTMPSITETLFALGLGNKVVGVTTNCNYPKEAQKIEKVGQMTINLEKVISLKPDLIIMLEDAQKYDIWRLKARGLPVATINPHNIDEVLKSIEYIGSATGFTYEARSYSANLKYRLSYIKSKSYGKATPSVFVMVGYKPLVSTGQGTFVDDVITYAGGQNIVKNKGQYPQVNFEELYRLNPEYIVIPTNIMPSSEVKTDRKLGRLTAVQNDKILWINPDILSRPGPRVIKAVEQISDFINK